MSREAAVPRDRYELFAERLLRFRSFSTWIFSNAFLADVRTGLQALIGDKSVTE